MKSYRGIISTEIIALFALAALASGRAGVIWAALLGSATARKGTPPSGALGLSGSAFTPIGMAVAAIVAVRYGKGEFGLIVAYLLGIMLLAAGLLNYQTLLPLFFKQVSTVQASVPNGPGTNQSGKGNVVTQPS